MVSAPRLRQRRRRRRPRNGRPRAGILLISKELFVTTTGESRTVDKVLRHARYGSSDTDIALLHLSEPSTVTTMQVIAQGELAAIATAR